MVSLTVSPAGCGREGLCGCAVVHGGRRERSLSALTHGTPYRVEWPRHAQDRRRSAHDGDARAGLMNRDGGNTPTSLPPLLLTAAGRLGGWKRSSAQWALELGVGASGRRVPAACVHALPLPDRVRFGWVWWASIDHARATNTHLSRIHMHSTTVVPALRLLI